MVCFLPVRHCYSRRSLLQSFYTGSRSIALSAETKSSSGARWFKEKFYPTSKAELETAEKKVLSYFKTPLKVYYVNIGPVIGREDIQIRTLSVNEQSKKTPIVLLQGFSHGIGHWVLNIDAIAAERPVHALDFPGFGRSSRPQFSKNGQESEMQMINCIEAWRKQMNLERFILLGFSMGGFFATSYAFKYPNRLSHLILVDPWGFQKKTSEMSFLNVRTPAQSSMHPLIGSVMYLFIRRINPLAPLRFFIMMRCGRQVYRATNPMVYNFSILGENAVDDMTEYMFHSNSQEPTGEEAFFSMGSSYGLFWAMFPMMERISTSLDKDVPLTLIYGTKSWLNTKVPVSEIQKLRPTSYVKELLIEGADHDCNVWDSTTFNKLVIEACEYGDKHFKR